MVRYWEGVAPSEAVARHLWVALKHEIEFRRPTFLDDVVVADVIAERVQGAKALFTTVIRRAVRSVYRTAADIGAARSSAALARATWGGRMQTAATEPWRV